MKSTRTSFRNMMWFSLLLIASLAVQGCFPYTSGYKPDPSRTSVVTSIDPATPSSKTAKIKLVGLPPESQLKVRAVWQRTGPAVETTRLFEQRYKDYWSLAIMPVGWAGVVLSPIFVLMSPILDLNERDNPNAMTVFGGWSAKGCEPKGLLLAYFIYSVGHLPTCQTVGEPRITESSKPLENNTTEESPFPGAKLRVTLTEVGGRVTMQGLILKTDINGIATIRLTTLFLTMSDSVRDVEAVVSLEGDPSVSARAPIPSAVVQAIAGPVRAEREGDCAAAAGKGLIALEHYARAASMSRGADVNSDLWKKIGATYNSFPVKPPIPDEARKFKLQAEFAYEQKRFADAANLYAAALKIASWEAELHFNRGLMLATTDVSNYREAVMEMKKYLMLAPNAPYASDAQDKIYQWESMIK